MVVMIIIVMIIEMRINMCGYYDEILFDVNMIVKKMYLFLLCLIVSYDVILE